MKLKILKEFEEKFGGGLNNNPDYKKAILDFLDNKLDEYAKAEVQSYKQFILNILDGVDKADELTNNYTGGTRAIREAIDKRII